jgi:hypothetical protein
LSFEVAIERNQPYYNKEEAYYAKHKWNPIAFFNHGFTQKRERERERERERKVKVTKISQTRGRRRKKAGFELYF